MHAFRKEVHCVPLIEQGPSRYKNDTFVLRETSQGFSLVEKIRVRNPDDCPEGTILIQ